VKEKVDVQLSRTLEGNECVFHDLHYTNDRYGGNKNETTFEISNDCGNPIRVEFDGIYTELDRVKIHIKGEIENSEFLRMLHLILEAEKMVSIIHP
jgi:hypothetical protein